MRRRQRHQSSSSLPWLLLMLLLLLLPVVRAIEIKWTPADGEGPMPASKKYRDAMARQQQQQQQQQHQHQQGGGMSEEDQLRMMQQMMMQQQGQQQRPPSFLERLLLAGYMAIGGTVAIAQRHPKAVATLSLTAVTGLCLRRAARRNGLLLTRRPHYWTLLEPPVEFLAALLEEELPAQAEKQEEQAAAVTAFQGTVSTAEAEEDEDGKTARRHVKVGEGEAAYRKAASLVRTLSLLDALAAEAGDKKGGPSVGRLFCSERMREGLFLAPRPGGSGWSIGPVAIRRRAGRLSSQSKKKGKKGKKKGGVVEEAYEEVVLRALPGCAWGRGSELRLAASWRDPAQGGDDAVYLSTAWYTPSKTPPRGLVPPKAAFLERVCEKGAAMVDQEMAILRVRERQQRQLAEDALKAEAERKRKERQAILNPPPDKKKWRKQHMSGSSGGQQGPARWQPSSDLQARRNPRRGG